MHQEEVWGNRRKVKSGELNQEACLLIEDATAFGHRQLPLQPA